MKFILVMVIFLAGCKSQMSKPVIVATSYPIAAILREIAGTDANVISIIPPGASPHTFSPKPSDIVIIQRAKAFFYISENYDGWAKQLQTKKSICVMDFLPDSMKIQLNGHNHSEGEASSIIDKDLTAADPHFWTDPEAVRTILPGLRDTLCRLDPENAGIYTANTDAFIQKLEVLDMQAAATLNNLSGRKVFLFHPSFLYLLKRYGLIYGGAIEISPGREPSPKYIAELVKKIRESGAKAIFSEAQFPESPARAIAEAAQVNIFKLDPLGGVPGRESYSEIIMYNARILKAALE